MVQTAVPSAPETPPNLAWLDSEPPAESQIAVDPVGLAVLLETVAAEVSVPVRPDQVLEVATRVAADTPSGLFRALRAAATAGTELGLLATAVRPTAAELVRRASEGACLVLALDEVDSGRWLVVRGRPNQRRMVVHEIEGGRVHRRRLRPRAVTARLEGIGQFVSTALDFESRYPLQPIVGHGGVGHGSGGGGEGDALRRLVRLVRLDRDDLWMVLVYAVFIGILTLMTPVAVQALVNTIAFGSVLQPLIILTLALLAGLAFGAVLQALRLYVVEVLQRRVFVRIATDFGRRLPRLAAEVHDHSHAPELANRFFDVITVQKAGSALAVDALGLVLQTAMGLCLLAFYHPLLLAFDVLLVLLLIAVIAIPARAGITTALAESKAKYATAAWLETVAGSPTLFRAAEPTDLAASRADALARRYLGARSAHWQKLVTQIAGGLGLQVIASVALLGVGGWLVINRQLTLGQLVAAELVVAAIGTGFAKLGKQLEKLYDAVAAVDKIGHVVDAERERDGGLRIDGHGPMALSLRQVRRAGEGGPELLEVIDLEVAPQGRVAVTGPSGSGKTTLLQLVAGLRAPSEGAVVASGVDLGHADLLLYRQAVAFLDEEALPNLSIGDYLRLGRNDASSETLRAALRKVSLEERVVRLPRGLDTMLLANGGPLSRTEARRLRLARALVQRPRLLIVDDLLDDLGLLEGAREALLDEVMGPHAPWTLMVSSSDPAVVSRCEQVLALEDHR